MGLGQLKRLLARNSLTGVIVDIDGRVLRAREFEQAPNHQEMVDFMRPYGQCAAIFFTQGEYSVATIRERIADGVNGIKLNQAGALKPGPNFL
jgi:hypothetical protein